MKDRRQDMRTEAALRVRITHPAFGTIVTTTRDVSDGGTFIAAAELRALPLGTVVTVQIMDSPVEAPVLPMRMVRFEKEGVGLAFIADDEAGASSGGTPQPD